MEVLARFALFAGMGAGTAHGLGQVRRDFYVVAYDISDHGRRRKVARLLKRCGERMQYSVLAMYLTREEWNRPWWSLTRLLVAQEDPLRVYCLCLACREAIGIWGQGAPTFPPGPVLV